MKTQNKDRQSLLLFTRLPLLGKTKTRLVPHIGEEAANKVQGKRNVRNPVGIVL